jgi:predicted DNA-binding transcriptional regulator YafY
MKLDRLIAILSVLLNQEQATAPELAKRFEVSRRTINRDIEALNQAGIPIVTQQGSGGGIRIMDGFRMDRTALTSREMQAILSGLRGLDSVSGTSQYKQLMEKISPGAVQMLPGDQHILIDLASWHKASLSGKIELLHGAIEQHRLVSFHYLSPGGESDRLVEPALLVFQWSSWYLWGWCREKAGPRLFKLDRMDRLRIGETFSPRKMDLPDLAEERAFPDRYQVTVRVSPKYKWRLAEEYGPGCYELTPEGDCLFSAGFADRDYLLSWILSFQGEAELVEPPELREELRKTGEIISRRHRT